MNVLSLFDGMSCGQIALNRAGIKYDNYFASEVDKHAIKVTQHNYPDTIQIGDVTKVKIKSLCLSEIYSYICDYDNNLQSNISEWEVLYWLNKEFTISAKITAQKPNERQEVSESPTIQRIEEVWFSRRGVGDIRKSRDNTRSRSDGKENDIRTPQQLQRSEWGYDNDIYRRYKEENIGITNRKTKNRNSEKKNFGNTEEAIFRGRKSKRYFGENEKSNVEERCSRELRERKRKDRFSRTLKKEERDRRTKEVGFIDNFVREFCRWDETNRVTQDYWNILQLHKTEQITVVEYEAGFYVFMGRIDLCIGGSPCQSFSFSGKMKGMVTNNDIPVLSLNTYIELKESGVEFHGQSYLFWEYVRLLNEVKPKYFLLENVMMQDKWKKIITDTLGVEPIMINSALVSAQNRKRLYWTNIPNITQPDDLGLTIKDILMPNADDSLFIENRKINGKNTLNKLRLSERGLSDKFRCLTARGQDGTNAGATTIRLPDGKLRIPTPEECEMAQTVDIGYTSCVSKTQRYRMLGNGWTVDVIAHLFKGLKDDISI